MGKPIEGRAEAVPPITRAQREGGVYTETARAAIVDVLGKDLPLEAVAQRIRTIANKPSSKH